MIPALNILVEYAALKGLIDGKLEVHSSSWRPSGFTVTKSMSPAYKPWRDCGSLVLPMQCVCEDLFDG